MASKEKNVENRRFCSFYLADRLFGIDITAVKEINDETHLTRINHAPAEIRGYVNIRGQIFLVLDLRHLMGMETRKTCDNTRLILFKTDFLENCGLLVDAVGDVVDVAANRIEDRRKDRSGSQSTMERRKDRSHLGAGVCKLDRQLMVILQPQNLLKYVEDKVADRI